MKQNIHHLYYLFYPRGLVSLRRSGWIIIALLLISASARAQETPSGQDKFYIGTEFQNETIENPSWYDLFYQSGMNLISQRADEQYTKQYLVNHDVLAVNVQHKEDWIAYYTTCYYSKWEAEVDAEPDRVGFKHRDSLGYLIGDTATWKDKLCWSSIGLSEPRDSLMYGPLYRQDKRYKRGLYYDPDLIDSVYYIPRFIMALDNHGNASPDKDVCKIKVVFRYKNEVTGQHHDYTFPLERTLKVGDFGTSGDFNEFYLFPDPRFATYCYPDQFWLPKNIENFPDAPSSVGYLDDESYTGIQYWVEWLGNDDLFTLYIDYVEVYDRDGWKDYIDRPVQTSKLITDYADSFYTTDWKNIKYWLGVDEPYSIDCYEPIRIVDELVRSVSPNTPVIVPFNPTWHWFHTINGEDEMSMFYNIAKPKRITLSVNPCDEENPDLTFNQLEWLRFNLQRTSALDSNFWFNAQTHGYWKNYTEPNEPKEWCNWRKPKPEELSAMVMLASAHGAKGIFFKWFNSYISGDEYCDATYKDCIVTPAPEVAGTELYYEIKNNLAPRLTGKLGKTLMNLNYTGDYIPYSCFGCPPHNSPLTSYLNLDCYASTFNWHAGFFEHKSFPDNKYFLLVNLITTNSVSTYLIVSNTTDYNNVSFTDIEGGVGRVDTTINYNSSIEYFENMPAGEGRLYRVAPVVKYGGNLIYPETISSTTTLHDEMVIQNNAVLTVNSTYNVYADIRVKAGGRIVTTGNGLIKFYQGHKLIIEGNAILNGTVSNKLKFEFTNPINSNGIIIKPGGSLVISYCEIKNAVKGITSELNLYNLNIQNVDFIDCDSVAVYIIGRNRLLDELTLTPPPPQIKYCNITNSDFGILVSNLSQIVIQQNTLTGTDLAISLSNVTTPSIINNTLTGSSEMPGIFLESCNGVVRGNLISGHTNGLTLGNSSPDIGGNVVEHNWNRGLYVGSGSLPNLRGKLVQDPIHPNIFYAVSGYNKINENGGWEREDDGSEIFINDANAILGDTKTYGCNEITDQRIPNTEDAPPLYNTQLLMNCLWSGHPQVVHAEGNFWNEHPIYRLEERFGDCTNIYLDPILREPCPLPDGSGGKLLITSSTGEVIDTLYAEERTIETLTETEELYATAEEKFLTSDFEDAEIIYNQIISGNDSLAIKLDAYRRLFEIGKFLGRDEEYFSGLRNTYLSLAGSANDTLLIKIFNQLSSLSLVANQEYVPAINEFDEIIQQNPNTEEAVFAEIDALTTALMVGDGDSTLQKGTLGKYFIKSSADYNSKLDGILRKHFGNGEKETEDEIIPNEYTLYQNYPNPFNPTTTIKYDLPNTSDVSLIIYDILGRKVKELVNTKQQAGRYEVQFNAINLSSGVYIYQLTADKFISSKKMILLK